MITRRTHAKALYPGILFPEEGTSIRIGNDLEIEEILSKFWDQTGWFAIEVTEQNYQLWTNDEDETRWLPQEGSKPKRWRIYIGELLTSAEVAALPGNHEILLANMKGNGWDPIVRTRRGNFQPLEEGDVVIAPEKVAS